MQAMLLEEIGRPLVQRTVAAPRPGPGELLLEVRACAVCRTDLHICDGELPKPQLPRIPGHEIVGVVKELGADVTGFRIGDRVGVPWLGWTCGECEFCRRGQENLCDSAQVHRLPPRRRICRADGRRCAVLLSDSRRHRRRFRRRRCYVRD